MQLTPLVVLNAPATPAPRAAQSKSVGASAGLCAAMGSVRKVDLSARTSDVGRRPCRMRCWGREGVPMNRQHTGCRNKG